MITSLYAQNKERGGQWSIRQLCLLFEVNRAWYYARKHITVELSKRTEEVALRDAIEGIILEFAGYGYRRVTKALVRAGWKVNHKRVWRIMRQAKLLCRRKRHHGFPAPAPGLNADLQRAGIGGERLIRNLVARQKT